MSQCEIQNLVITAVGILIVVMNRPLTQMYFDGYERTARRLLGPPPASRFIRFGWIAVGIGFIIAAFTAKRQALHDMIAETLVVKR